MSSRSWLLLLLVISVPLSFIGLGLWALIDGRHQIDQTVAGGLVAVLGAIVAGVFNLLRDDKDNDS